MKKSNILHCLFWLLAPVAVFAQDPDSSGTLIDPLRHARVPVEDISKAAQPPAPALSLWDKAFGTTPCFPRGQGYILVCSGCAIANALAVQRKLAFDKKNCPARPVELFAPCFLFVQCVQHNKKGEELGAFVPDMLDTFRAQGICLKKDWPDDCFKKCSGRPAQGQKAKAKIYRIDSFTTLISKDSFAQTNPGENYEEHQKNWLREKIKQDRPVIAVLRKAGSCGHSVAVIGYDDDKKEVEILDSEGGTADKDCCTGRRTTMPYKEFFGRLAEAYVMTLRLPNCNERQ